MKLSLNALLTRSMTSDVSMVGVSQRHTMRWPTLAAIIGGSILFVVAVVGALFFTFRPVTLRIAVGPPGSDDARVIQAIVQGFARERNYIHIRAVAADNATESASLLGSGQVDLAVVRGDLDLPKNAQAVAILRKNVVTIWAPVALSKPKKGRGKNAKDPDPPKIEDLAGRKIGLVGNSVGNLEMLKRILQQYGVPADKVTLTQFSTNGVADAVRSQKVDAFMAVGPVNSRITTEAIAASVRNGGEPIFFPIDAAESIVQDHPTFEVTEIPAGAFGVAPSRPDDSIDTIGFSHFIVARKDLSDSTVGAFTRELFSVRQSVMGELPGVAKIETPDTAKDAAILAHPGAAAYVDGEERTFLDRYSDYMWGGLMLLSVLGSAAAWFASYMRRDERTANTSQRERLLDMITAARNSDSTDELEQFQTEADQILRHTLTCFEDGAIEEGTLTAFNIALDQFHNAVADRRAVLESRPAVLRSASQFRA